MFKFSPIVISLLLAGPAAAAVLDIQVCGTGLAADCKTLNIFSQGATDIHYALIAVPVPPPGTGPNAVTGSAYLTQDGVYAIGGGVWMDNGPSSAWITPTANQADMVQGSDWLNGQHYIYQTTFFMPTAFGSAVIDGQWATDNAGIAILLNGNDTHNTIGYGTSGSYGFQHYTPFTIGTNSWFHPGLNTLDFVVANGNNAGDIRAPSGLRVEIDGATYEAPDLTKKSAGNPEPATFGLLLCGLPVALYLKRKRV